MRTLSGGGDRSARYVYRVSTLSFAARAQYQLTVRGRRGAYLLSEPQRSRPPSAVHYSMPAYHAIGMPPAGTTDRTGGKVLGFTDDDIHRRSVGAPASSRSQGGQLQSRALGSGAGRTVSAKATPSRVIAGLAAI